MSRLESLAQERFGTLTRAESELLRNADKGEFAVCGPSNDDDDPANGPAQADEWGDDREIHADVIRWLCVNRAASELVDPKGIQVYGARVPDALDLVSVLVPFPFHLSRCRLMAAFNLVDAEIPGINLDGTWVNSVVADGARVKGNVFMRAGFHATGGVRFPSARIGAFFDCSGGSFKGLFLPEQKNISPALEVGGSIVGDGVFLRDGFCAEGEVRLHRVRVGVDIDCRGGMFTNPALENTAGSGKAFTADGAVVGGSVSLATGFSAKGEVRLLGAQIGSNLYCQGGAFENPLRTRTDGSGTTLIDGTGTAINADGINVNGGLFLRDGFCAEGQVRLARSRIGLDLDCKKARFKGELFAEGAKIGGAVFWTGLASPLSTKLDLMNASVAALVDDAQSWPPAGNLRLDGFLYERIYIGPKDSKARLKWLARVNEFAPQPFRQLAKVLRDEGDEVGARDVLFEMERLRRKKEDISGLRRLWSAVLRWTIGYGYYPAWALRWLFGSMLLGLILYWGGYNVGTIVPTDPTAYCSFRQDHRSIPAYYEHFHASMYSLESSFPLVKLGQVERWQPDPGPQRSVKRARLYPFSFSIWISLAGFLRWFRWGQILFGWFFATLGIAGVTGLVRRD